MSDLEVDVFTILVDRRLGDIEPTVFQQTFLEEEHSVVRTTVVGVEGVTIKSLTIFVDEVQALLDRRPETPKRSILVFPSNTHRVAHVDAIPSTVPCTLEVPGDKLTIVGSKILFFVLLELLYFQFRVPPRQPRLPTAR